MQAVSASVFVRPFQLSHNASLALSPRTHKYFDRFTARNHFSFERSYFNFKNGSEIQFEQMTRMRNTINMNVS